MTSRAPITNCVLWVALASVQSVNSLADCGNSFSEGLADGLVRTEPPIGNLDLSVQAKAALAPPIRVLVGNQDRLSSVGNGAKTGEAFYELAKIPGQSSNLATHRLTQELAPLIHALSKENGVLLIQQTWKKRGFQPIDIVSVAVNYGDEFGIRISTLNDDLLLGPKTHRAGDVLQFNDNQLVDLKQSALYKDALTALRALAFQHKQIALPLLAQTRFASEYLKWTNAVPELKDSLVLAQLFFKAHHKEISELSKAKPSMETADPDRIRQAIVASNQLENVEKKLIEGIRLLIHLDLTLSLADGGRLVSRDSLSELTPHSPPGADLLTSLENGLQRQGYLWDVDRLRWHSGTHRPLF